MYRGVLLVLACVLAVVICFVFGVTGVGAVLVGFPLGYVAMTFGRKLDER